MHSFLWWYFSLFCPVFICLRLTNSLFMALRRTIKSVICLLLSWLAHNHFIDIDDFKNVYQQTIFGCSIAYFVIFESSFWHWRYIQRKSPLNSSIVLTSVTKNNQFEIFWWNLKEIWTMQNSLLQWWCSSLLYTICVIVILSRSGKNRSERQQSNWICSV